jgi:hypothetical protein
VIFYGGIFLCLLRLKLALHSSSTHHHVRVAPLSTVFLPLVEGSLLVCTCLVSGWQMWAFMRFLDDEGDTTTDFRGFPISHEKQTVKCR